ncbi:MAG: HlyD family efflux transporter periplasmic adaptor subunit [Rhodopirellula sp.]|nr:HlyD family efflux transporter periplasmic adaptor subunit [Rhodopirellula sp.]
MTRFVRFLFACAVAGALVAYGSAWADETAAKPKAAEPAAKSAPKSDQDKSEKSAEPVKEETAGVKKQPAVEKKSKPEESKAEPSATETKSQSPIEKPKTVRVAKEPFKVDLSLKGVFEATNAAEIALRLKQWKELTVVHAVKHGQEVREGDVLVQLDLEKIDDQIADLRKDLKISELSLKQAESNLKILETATPLDLELAARNKQIADEDLQRFLEIDKPLIRKSADFMLKISQDNLDYEKEELRQLEKMYKADDLTEDTEEIILKRQRDTVARAEFFLGNAKVHHEESLQVDLPREEQSRKFLTKQQELLHRKSQASLPVALEQQRIQLEKMAIEKERSQQRLKELEADRDRMTVKAPMEGIVYYGQYVRGQWAGATSTADDLRGGGNLTRDKVVMTVVKARPMVIRADVPENSLHYLRPGLKGVVTPTGYPDLQLPATIDAFETVPLGGQFAATVKVSLPHEADPLMPGMNCTVRITPYLKKSALVAPASAVFSETLEPNRRYVYLHREGEEPRKQAVVVGEKAGDKIEILEGLDNGDEILQEEPKNKDS